MKEFLIKLGLSVAAVFVPIKSMMIVVGILVLADLITGILAARKRGEKITSAGLRRSVVKGMIFQAAVMLGFLTEKYLMDGTIPISKIVAGLVGATELTSILENLDTINGSPIFKSLVQKLSSKNDVPK